MKRKVIFIGGIGSKTQFGGELTKNKLILEKLKADNFIIVRCIDTYRCNHNLIKKINVVLQILISILFTRDCIFIISTSSNNTYQLLKIFDYFPFQQDIYYWVIGGKFGRLLLENKYNKDRYRIINSFFVEGKLMCEQLKKCGFENVSVVPNFKHIPNIPTINKYDDNKTHFLFLSRITKEKGCDLVLNCMKKLNEMGYKDFFVVDFYGIIKEAYKQKFISKINFLPNAYYKGTIDLSNSDNYQLLSKYHYMLFPTFWEGEGFPGVIIDSFIAGVPLIASDWNLNPEYVIDGYNGIIIKSKNENDLYMAMENAIKNEYNIQTLSINCQNEASKYDINNIDTNNIITI